MKVLILLLLTFLASLVQADDHQEQKLSRQGQRYFRCVREVLQKNVNNTKYFNLFLKQFQEIKETPRQSLDFLHYRSACIEVRNSQKKQSKEERKRSRYLTKKNLNKLNTWFEQSLANGHDEKTVRTIYGLIFPRISCKKVSFSAQAFILMGQIGAGYCESTDGRRWFEIVPAGGYGPGAGAFASVDIGKSERHDYNPSLYLIDGSVLRRSTFAVLVGIRTTGKGQKSETMAPDGLGVGLIYQNLRVGKLHIKIVPLPYKADHIFNSLL